MMPLLGDVAWKTKKLYAHARYIHGSRSCIAWRLKKFENTKSMKQLHGLSSGLCMMGAFCVTKMKHGQTIWFCRDKLSLATLFWQDIIAWLACFTTKKDTSVTFWAERIFFCHTYDTSMTIIVTKPGIIIDVVGSYFYDKKQAFHPGRAGDALAWHSLGHPWWKKSW